jgi:hypothetical protein
MLDIVFVADPAEDVVGGVFVAGVTGELGAIIGRHPIDGVGDDSDQATQELGGDHLASPLVPLDKGRLAGPTDCHEQA